MPYLLARLFLLSLLFMTSTCTMIHGYGVEVKSWFIVIGGFIGAIVIGGLAAAIDD